METITLNWEDAITLDLEDAYDCACWDLRNAKTAQERRDAEAALAEICAQLDRIYR